MKKIGIVTWFVSHNYGTNLQAYALFKILSQLGYDCKLIFEENKPKCLKDYITTLFSILGIKDLLINLKIKGIQRKKLYDFITKDLKVIKVRSTSQHKKLSCIFDIFISGSDQIWNPNYVSPFLLLAFANNNKRIAYATSIGVDSLPPDLIPFYRKHLSKFSHISIREKRGCELIKSFMPSSNIRQVLDPTFLLEPKDWNAFGKKAKLEFIPPSKYMLVYLIGKNEYYVKAVKQISSLDTNIATIVISSTENNSLLIPGAFHYKQGGPKEFINLIEHAECICTDSFHACAISINLTKQFYVFKRFNDKDQSSQNSRIYDLLGHYGLLDRLIESNHSLPDKIDYDPIQKLLSSERKDCISYLVNSIEY